MKKDKPLNFCECGVQIYASAKSCRSCHNRTRHNKDSVQDTRRALKIAIRGLPDYKMWKETVMMRDSYKCRGCSTLEKLDIHHLYMEFDDLIIEFSKQYESLLNDRRTILMLASTYIPFWNIENGVTVCRECHLKCHDSTLKLENKK